ncbi:ABC transporter [Chitinispirillum alkaliphilum]|nr:ABC transporter [Chitinispirillum alkaliphilum]
MAVPFLNNLIYEQFTFDLSEHYLMMVTFLALMMAMLSGSVFSFITLDERDESIITALSVTPLTNRGYIRYRLVITSAFSFILYSVVLLFNGLIDVPLSAIFSTALVASLNGGLFLLFIASTAENKIEGLALTKIGGLYFFIPLAAYLIPSTVLQVPFALLPSFWIVPVMFTRGVWLFLSLLGFTACTIFWYWVLLGRFKNRVL